MILTRDGAGREGGKRPSAGGGGCLGENSVGQEERFGE